MERPDPELVDALRADLTAAGYTVEGVEELLGPVAHDALGREQALPALRATAGRREPLAVLARTFLLGRPVPRADLDAALPRLGTQGAARLGLVTAGPGTSADDGAPRADDDVRLTDDGASPTGDKSSPADDGIPLTDDGASPASDKSSPAGDGAPPTDDGRAEPDAVFPILDLRPYTASDAHGEIAWWIASDLGELATGRALRTDHVLGVGGASLTLAQVTIRSPRGRTLDLGTGCGIQALHAARHSDHVVATDVSQRALAVTALNAALAGVDLEVRHGSMLDPVAGERFDLVVSNPPFVITPRVAGVPEYEYRDGGATGHAVVRDLVTSVRDVLAPGGIAQLLGNWEVREGEDWRDVVGGWLDASGLDGWVIERESLDPAQYAETWLRDGGTTPERDRELWSRTYGAWLDDFAARDVARIGFGIITLRRPLSGAPTLRRLEEHPGALQQPLGPVIEAFLAAHDWLEAAADGALAASRLRLAADVTEERHLTPGHADPQVILLRQGGGFGRTVQVGTASAGLVGACDGELTVAQIMAALGHLLGRDADDVAREVLPVVRGLVRDGLLLAGEAATGA